MKNNIIFRDFKSNPSIMIHRDIFDLREYLLQQLKSKPSPLKTKTSIPFESIKRKLDNPSLCFDWDILQYTRENELTIRDVLEIEDPYRSFIFAAILFWGPDHESKPDHLKLAFKNFKKLSDSGFKIAHRFAFYCTCELDIYDEVMVFHNRAIEADDQVFKLGINIYAEESYNFADDFDQHKFEESFAKGEPEKVLSMVFKEVFQNPDRDTIVLGVIKHLDAGNIPDFPVNLLIGLAGYCNSLEYVESKTKEGERELFRVSTDHTRLVHVAYENRYNTMAYVGFVLGISEGIQCDRESLDMMSELFIKTFEGECSTLRMDPYIERMKEIKEIMDSRPPFKIGPGGSNVIIFKIR